MKGVSVLFCLLTALVSVHGQEEDPGPSPTASVGCEPHGDHWHCEGPRTEEVTAPPTTASSSVDPGPSPTESANCEPHGDHWHCDEPTTGAPAPTTSASGGGGDDDDDEDDGPTGSGSVDPGPSPTESVGCEPHGDHWHCDGPAETTSAGPDEAQESDGAGVPNAVVGYGYPIAGALAVVGALF